MTLLCLHRVWSHHSWALFLPLHVIPQDSHQLAAAFEMLLIDQACVWSSLSTWTHLLLTFATGVNTQAPWGIKPILSEMNKGEISSPQSPTKRRKSSLRRLMRVGRALPAMSPPISVKEKLSQKKAFCFSVDSWEMVMFGIVLGIGGRGGTVHTPSTLCLVLFLFLESMAANDCAWEIEGPMQACLFLRDIHWATDVNVQKQSEFYGLGGRGGGAFFNEDKLQFEEAARITSCFKY